MSKPLFAKANEPKPPSFKRIGGGIHGQGGAYVERGDGRGGFSGKPFYEFWWTGGLGVNNYTCDENERPRHVL